MAAVSRVFRLAGRSELWPVGTVEALRGAPRRFLLEPDSELEAALLAAGLEFELLSGSAGSQDVFLIPMHPLETLVALTDRLLGPGGCPWDQEQTHQSLKRYLLEETYEVLEAIDAEDMDQLCEELGDLALQPILHAQKAEGFDSAEVGRRIVDKLIRRHPHVFGEVEVSDSAAVLRNWDRIKAAEKGGAPRSLLAGVPKGMAALLRAHEISKRAARAGFEWPDVDAVWDKFREEERELREASSPAEVEAELGDLLFTVVNLGRWMGVEPEEALRRMLDRFTARFQAMEQASSKPLDELSAQEWDALWESAKQAQSGKNSE